jgi:hypothetical protein
MRKTSWCWCLESVEIGEELATGVNLEGKSVGDGTLTYLLNVVLKKNSFAY